jgi:hypothetical protein
VGLGRMLQQTKVLCQCYEVQVAAIDTALCVTDGSSYQVLQLLVACAGRAGQKQQEQGRQAD